MPISHPQTCEGAELARRADGSVVGSSGFTLVELIASLAILSMAVAVVLALRSSPPADGPREVLNDVLDLDAFARMFAERRGPHLVEVADDGPRLLSGWTGAGEFIRNGHTWSEGCVVGVFAAGSSEFAGLKREPLGFIRYDATGRSRDYVIEVDCGGNRASALVYGVSGWAEIGP